MRVFLAGASGALGRRLIGLLVAHGHAVTAMTRSKGKAGALRALGAEPVVADGLDKAAVMSAVVRSGPEAVIHEMTGLRGVTSVRRFDREFAPTNRLRTEGLDILLEAARTAGARRLVAQSFGNWNYARSGGPVKGEDDPLDPAPPAAMSRSLAALRHLESAVLEPEDIEGVVLRYANFYGPGAMIGEGGAMVDEVRRRGVPVIGDGGGVWSFVHLDDAAAATVLALEGAVAGIYNIADDDPATAAVWLPELARVLGAKPPRRVPVWLGRLAAGAAGVSLFTQIRGASNAKARRELGWQPAYASWRDGFRHGLGLPWPATTPAQVRLGP
jgi:2-alkyl-3-oxoalkanoate reductase